MQQWLFPYPEKKPFNRKALLLFIILLMTINQMAITIYLPAMPSIVSELHTNNSLVKLSVTLFIFAFGCSQFVYGPLSDIHGRRIIVLIGLSIFIIASIMAVIAPNIYVFLIARSLQGVGIACGDTMGRAIMCDVFKGRKFVRAAAYISMAATVTPLIAPVLGGYLDYLINWRACFGFLLSYAIIISIIVTIYLPETKPTRLEPVRTLRGISNSYWFILRNRIFLGFFIPGLVSFFGETIYNMFAPFLLQQQLGLTPVEFGWLTIFIIVGLFIGAITAKVFSSKVSHHYMVLVGLCILIVGSLTMLLPSLFSIMNVVTIILPMVIFTAGVGITYPNTNMGALAPFTAMAGTAGALQGGLQMVTSGILGMLLTDVHTETQQPLAWVLTIISAIGLIMFIILVKPHKASQNKEPADASPH